MPVGNSDSASFPSFMGPISETALAGVNMPIANLTLSSVTDAVLTIVLATSTGKLYADPAAGATVSGGGSSSLWITGTVTQVNAKLATLAYAEASAGADTLTISVLDQTGRIAALTSIPVPVLPPGASTPDTITARILLLRHHARDPLLHPRRRRTRLHPDHPARPDLRRDRLLRADTMRKLAEGMRFELTIRLDAVWRFSKPLPSATRPPLRRGCNTAFAQPF